MKTLRAVDHPNVMEVYEIFEDKEKYYIATELLRGGQLDQRIAEVDQIEESEVRNMIH